MSSSYDVLKCYPEFFREIEEIKSLAAAEKARLTELQTVKNFMLNDITLETSQMQGDKRWETILGKYESGALTTADKRAEVKMRIAFDSVLTMESIRNYLSWRLGEGKYEAVYDAEKFVLSVSTEPTLKNKTVLYEDLREYVPCNIALVVT